MSTRFLKSSSLRLLAALICSATATGCGSELLRTGRAPVYLVVTDIAANPGGGQEEFSFLNSDVVLNDGSVRNDNVVVTLRLEPKDPSAATSSLNAVTLTRYRVNFRRTDGRNAPGVDVPYGFDGAVTALVPLTGTTEASFELVRHQMKLEPPLKNLAGFDASGARSISGLGFLSTIAEVTLWGRDQNGNEVTTTASIDVHFANFNDE